MSHLVNWPVPLTRLNPFYPGQIGVLGTWNETGLRNSCDGAIFYVDPNYPGVSDARDGTDPTAPLATIAAALTKCQPYRGDVIAVMGNNAWQYGAAADGRRLPISEEVIVDVPGVRIVGVDPSSPSGVVWTPASNGGICITVRALDVLIEGFHFYEGAFAGCNAIYALWNGTTAFGDNMVIRNCTFDDTVDIAIQLEYSWYCEIYNNIFWECDTAGIYTDPLGQGANYLKIFSNTFHDCGAALPLRGVDNSHIYDNSIYNGNAQGAGVATNEGIDLTNGVNNQIFANVFSCLLPVPANGDWDDLNSGGGATNAWIANACTNGTAVTTPT